MPVNLKAPKNNALHSISGIKLGIAEAEIRYKSKKDLLIISIDSGAVVSGIFTKNKFIAAPVIVAKDHLKINSSPRALIVNTGSANAGTGEDGLKNARVVCEVLANELNIKTVDIIPFSTGVIMTHLPVDKIYKGIPVAIKDLKSNNWLNAAESIMTTDTVAKASSTTVMIQDTEVYITGISKGSGMIHPNMATMLGFVATNANITKEMLDEMIIEIADNSFNCITVDGETSTNDSFIIIATNQSIHQLINTKNENYYSLKEALLETSKTLAQSIIRDGEGATKFISINVHGGKSRKECLSIGKSIAHSPLVKTAFFASDPNIGRILAAIGNSPIELLDINLVDVFLNQIQFAKSGSLAKDYKESKGAKEMKNQEITLDVYLGRGEFTGTVWTTDLSYDYVKINSEYRS
ncbi:bifunctional glutamate N-acetyltransferase/amino-acid acetyltransferase ArgJ [Methylophilaceae bacterium]|nr:bifunctional glutamate N-acetyltransferase/amino-acid acetyltransferase ArgJ [Methylophilaceae bacterium]